MNLGRAVRGVVPTVTGENSIIEFLFVLLFEQYYLFSIICCGVTFPHRAAHETEKGLKKTWCLFLDKFFATNL